MHAPRLSNRGCLAVRLIIVAATCGGAAALQTNTGPTLRRGMTSAWAAGFSLATTGASTGATNDTVLKPPHSIDQGTAVWTQITNVTSPDYSVATMFPGFQSIDVDAHSTGNGVTPRMTTAMKLAVGTGAPWFNVVASVTRNTSGGSTGSHFARAVAENRHPGSELVGYYFEGSTGINPRLVGATVLESSGPDLRFMGVGGSGLPEIDALDFGLGVISHNDPPFPGSAIFFSRRTEYYFSVSRAWAQANPSAKFASTSASTTPSLPPDPRVVYLIEWNGNSWSTPVIHIDAAELGLGPDEDLDALEVDRSNETVLFSTAGPGAASQIMFMQRLQSGKTNGHAQSPVPLPAGLGTSATGTAQDRIDVGNLEDDDVDALCSTDPESSAQAMMIALPKSNTMYVNEPMGLSMSRRKNLPPSSNVPSDCGYVIHVTGWGDGVSTNGFVLFEVHPGPISAGVPAPTTGWIPFRYVPRDSTQHVFEQEWPYEALDGSGPAVYIRARGWKMGPTGLEPNGETWAAEIRL